MEPGPAESSTQEKRSPISVVAHLGPVPGAAWWCPTCDQRGVSIAPKILEAFSQRKIVQVTCNCGSVLELGVSMIERVNKRPVVKRKPIIL